MSIEESKDTGRMTIDELQSSLSVHEKKFKKSIYHPSRGKIAESVMSANRMFVLLGETSDKAREERCLQVDVANKEELWHHRYGHLSYKGLLTLRNKEMVNGLPDIGRVQITCEACVKRETSPSSFPKTEQMEINRKTGTHPL